MKSSSSSLLSKHTDSTVGSSRHNMIRDSESQRTLTGLPLEILFSISRYLEKEDLRSLVLVNKLSNQIASQYLYEDIEMTVRRKNIKRKLKSFQYTIDGRPDLAQRVKSLYATIDCSTAFSINRYFSDLFPHLPALASIFILLTGSWGCEPPLSLRAIDSLKSLRHAALSYSLTLRELAHFSLLPAIETYAGRGKILGRRHSDSEQIRSQSLDEVLDADGIASNNMPRTSHLKHLVLGDFPPLKEMRDILTWCKEIEVLSIVLDGWIGYCREDLVHFLLTVSDTVEILALRLSICLDQFAYNDNQPDQSILNLSQFKKVQELVVSAAVLFPHFQLAPDPGLRDPLYRYLPPNVEVLTIQFSRWPVFDTDPEEVLVVGWEELQGDDVEPEWMQWIYNLALYKKEYTPSLKSVYISEDPFVLKEDGEPVLYEWIPPFEIKDAFARAGIELNIMLRSPLPFNLIEFDTEPYSSELGTEDDDVTETEPVSLSTENLQTNSELSEENETDETDEIGEIDEIDEAEEPWMYH